MDISPGLKASNICTGKQDFSSRGFPAWFFSCKITPGGRWTSRIGEVSKHLPRTHFILLCGPWRILPQPYVLVTVSGPHFIIITGYRQVVSGGDMFNACQSVFVSLTTDNFTLTQMMQTILQAITSHKEATGPFFNIKIVFPQKWKSSLCDCHGHHKRHWSLTSTSPVMIRAIIMTTFPLQCPSIRISIVKIGQSWDHLTFTMEILILARQHLPR